MPRKPKKLPDYFTMEEANELIQATESSDTRLAMRLMVRFCLQKGLPQDGIATVFHQQPNLTTPSRGHPYTVIENVPTAGLRADIVLTGPLVGLPYIERRRHFEVSWTPATRNPLQSLGLYRRYRFTEDSIIAQRQSRIGRVRG